MIYLYAIFFGAGAMHLMKFLWANYSALVIGPNAMEMIQTSEVMQAAWAGSYLVFALLVILAASVPAAKARDFTLAGINSAIIGTMVGIGFAALLFLRGDGVVLVDMARVAFVPVGLSLLVGMAGFGGALLYMMDGGASIASDTVEDAANDNDGKVTAKIAA